jgi:hypothetical protein
MVEEGATALAVVCREEWSLLQEVRAREASRAAARGVEWVRRTLSPFVLKVSGGII